MQIFINIALAVSYQLLFGYARLVSFGHAGFFGLSAYTAGVLIVQYKLPTLLSWLIGIVTVLVVAVILAVLVIKLEPLLLSITTLAVSQIIYLVLSTMAMTGGENGLILNPLTVGAIDLATFQYWFAAGGMLLVVAATTAIVNSTTGRLLVAVGDDVTAARALGVNSSKVMVFGFAAATGLVSIAGIMLLESRFVLTPADADIHVTILVLAMVALGGFRSIIGAVIGAVILSAIPVLFATMSGYTTIIYGGIMLAIMLLSPGGIMGLIAGWRQRMLKGSRP
jgi:branched-chain amino acid transport system permease protein